MNNESIGKHYLQALLLSRLLALHYVVTHSKPDNRLAYLWALCQYRPGLILPTVNGEEVFSLLYSHVVQYSSECIADGLTKLLGILYTLVGLVYVVSDESQVLVVLHSYLYRSLINITQLLFDKCVNKFVGLTHFEKRSVFSKLVATWTESTQLLLVLAGTGLRLRKSLKFSASGILKPEADLEKYTIVDFGLFNTLSEMQVYLMQYFPLSNEQAVEIYSYLKGNEFFFF